MNYDKHRLAFPIRALSAFLLGSLFFCACQQDLPQVPDEQDFLRKDLEKLGDLLRQEILDDFELLPQSPPFDTSVYWYVQTLYNQSTSIMHLDKQSAPDNRWDQTRQWRVFIIDDREKKLAFALPGGDIFISTGMLLCFEKEYELYSVLSFEAALMTEGSLLSAMIMEHNSLAIRNLIDGGPQQDGFNAAVLAEELTELVYDEKTVKEIDEVAIKNTCRTSILEPAGLVPLLNRYDAEDCLWLQTRPSYTARAQHLPTLVEVNCGGNLGTGTNYQRFVLNPLAH